MPDMEKVIKDLEDVREYIRTSKDTGLRKARMMDKVTNAIELLKEQGKNGNNRLPYSPDSNVQWT